MPSPPWLSLVKLASRNPGPTCGKVWSHEGSPSTEGDQIGEHLNKMDIHESTGCEGMHSWVLRELADVTDWGGS